MKNSKQIAVAILMLCLTGGQSYARASDIDVSTDWNTARNSSYDVKSGLTIGANGYAYHDATNALAKNKLYLLKADIDVKGKGESYFGVAFYDKNQKLLKTAKAPLKKDNFRLEFAVPAYADHFLLFAKTDPGFNGQVKINDVSLSFAPQLDEISK